MLIQKGCLTVFPLAMWTFAAIFLLEFPGEVHGSPLENGKTMPFSHKNGSNKMGQYRFFFILFNHNKSGGMSGLET